MADQSDDQWAAYQGPQDSYQHVHTEPLVSALLPSSGLAKDFQDADPNFVVKVANLSYSHPWMRRVRGDGSCGFRAVCFAYFEFLLSYCTVEKINQEFLRFQSTDELLTAAGTDPSLFTDQTVELFEEILKWMSLSIQDRIHNLHQAFLDDQYSPPVVYHFRLLASSYIKCNPDDYAPWLVDRTVDEYAEAITRPDEQIDELGVRSLYAVVLQPLGLGLEILDLNRSTDKPITESYVHMPEVLCRPDAIVRLLYRPGHYDLVYTDHILQRGDIPQNSWQTDGALSNQVPPPSAETDRNFAAKGNLAIHMVHSSTPDGDYSSMTDLDYDAVVKAKTTLSPFLDPRFLPTESPPPIAPIYGGSHPHFWPADEPTPTYPTPCKLPKLSQSPPSEYSRINYRKIQFRPDRLQDELARSDANLEAFWDGVLSEHPFYQSKDFGTQLDDIPTNRGIYFSDGNPLSRFNLSNFQPAVLTLADGPLIEAGVDRFDFAAIENLEKRQWQAVLRSVGVKKRRREEAFPHADE